MVTLTAPAAWAGVTAMINISPVTENVVAGIPSKVTELAPIKPVPYICKSVPPAIGPMFGVRLVNVGAGDGVGGIVGEVVVVVMVPTEVLTRPYDASTMADDPYPVYTIWTVGN